MRYFPLRLEVALPLAALLLLVLGVGGLYGIRAVESYDPFCTSCHLQDHQEYLDDGARPAKSIRSLAGWHLTGEKAKCISCHGEEGIVGMARTTFLAAKDTVKFVLGDYEHPSRVFHPIADKDCLKCHADERILKLEEDDFHAILDHATLPFSCVQCHNGHLAGGRSAKRLVVPRTAQPRCDHCHNKLEQKVRVGGNLPDKKKLRLAGIDAAVLPDFFYR